MDDATQIRRAQQAERQFLAGVVRGWRLEDARRAPCLPSPRIRAFRARESRTSAVRSASNSGSDDPHIGNASLPAVDLPIAALEVA